MKKSKLNQDSDKKNAWFVALIILLIAACLILAFASCEKYNPPHCRECENVYIVTFSPDIPGYPDTTINHLVLCDEELDSANGLELNWQTQSFGYTISYHEKTTCK